MMLTAACTPTSQLKRSLQGEGLLSKHAITCSAEALGNELGKVLRSITVHSSMSTAASTLLLLLAIYAVLGIPASSAHLFIFWSWVHAFKYCILL
jgi:hypothetical protein